MWNKKKEEPEIDYEGNLNHYRNRINDATTVEDLKQTLVHIIDSPNSTRMLYGLLIIIGNRLHELGASVTLTEEGIFIKQIEENK